jgi:GT2 family glycosyltransferase
MPEKPLLSIVIPTYERKEALQTCLASIESAHRPDPIEVIVIDDGGSTSLEGVVAPFRSSIGASLIRRKHGGPAAARNTGVSHARGSFIVFIDDDCTLDRGALEAFARALRNNPRAVVGGRTRNRLTHNPYAAASQWIVDVVYAYYNADPSGARFFATTNMAVERHAFLEVDGFDERFTIAAEDREFCDRWRVRGGRLVYETDAVVNHAHDLTLAGFVRQHVRYGRGAYRYHRVRARRASGSIHSELGFHAGLPARLIRRTRREPPRKAAADVALFAVWQLANASGFLGAAAIDGIERVCRLNDATAARQATARSGIADKDPRPNALDDAHALP